VQRAGQQPTGNPFPKLPVCRQGGDVGLAGFLDHRDRLRDSLGT